MSGAKETLKRICSLVGGSGERTDKAKLLAEAVRSLRNHRWTGMYDVGKEMVSIIAYSSAAHGCGTSSGPGAPAYPTFPVTQGLTSAAIQGKKTIIVGDVRTDARYLTAFGNTLSEIIVPIIDPRNGTVVGTIDVESERVNAFSADDQRLLEECARAALPLWIGQ